MHVISTVKDREVVLRRKVCVLTQRKRSTGHFWRPVMRWILPEHMECKSRAQGGKNWVPLCWDFEENIHSFLLKILLGALLRTELKSGMCPRKV